MAIYTVQSPVIPYLVAGGEFLPVPGCSFAQSLLMPPERGINKLRVLWQIGNSAYHGVPLSVYLAFRLDSKLEIKFFAELQNRLFVCGIIPADYGSLSVMVVFDVIDGAIPAIINNARLA